MPDLSKMKKPDVKLVFLGDMNVGKTSLLHRYMERKFKDTISTVGGAFFLKQWGPYNISIWDTAGNTPACFLTWLVCVLLHYQCLPEQTCCPPPETISSMWPLSDHSQAAFFMGTVAWKFFPCLLGTTRAAHVKPGTIQSFQVRQEENNPIIQHNEVQPDTSFLSETRIKIRLYCMFEWTDRHFYLSKLHRDKFLSCNFEQRKYNFKPSLYLLLTLSFLKTSSTISTPNSTATQSFISFHNISVHVFQLKIFPNSHILQGKCNICILTIWHVLGTTGGGKGGAVTP